MIQLEMYGNGPNESYFTSRIRHIGCCRGGGSSSAEPASRRNGSVPSSTDNYVGFRIALYVQ